MEPKTTNDAWNDSSAGRADIDIRPGVVGDAGRIHRALRDFASAMGEPERITSTARDILIHGFGERPAFETLIAESGSRFAGMCLFFPSFSTWRGAPGIYVQDIWVEPEFRGLDIGERLIRRVAGIAHARGGRYLRLSVDAGNTAAIRFYERLGLGFSRDERIHAASGAAFLALVDNGVGS